MNHKTRLTITLTSRTAVLALLMTLILSAPLDLGSETMTMTATYPSPVGIYRSLITTGGTSSVGANTLLARDGGKVGIGTPTPGAKLDVNGNANVSGNMTAGSITGGSAIINGAFKVVTSNAPQEAGDVLTAAGTDGTAVWKPAGGASQVASGDVGNIDKGESALSLTAPSASNGLPSGNGSWYCANVALSGFNATPQIIISIEQANAKHSGGNTVDAVELAYANVSNTGFTACGRTSTNQSDGWDSYPSIYWLAIGSGAGGAGAGGSGPGPVGAGGAAWITAPCGGNCNADANACCISTNKSPDQNCVDQGYSGATGACKANHIFGTIWSNNLSPNTGWSMTCVYGNIAYEAPTYIQCAR